MRTTRSYKNVHISIYNDVPPLLVNRISKLCEQVLEKLPDEEQFKMPGKINFLTKQEAIRECLNNNSQINMAPDFIQYNADGHCTYDIVGNVENSSFCITIIVDDLVSKSDDYIKGLVVHELSEMSYSWISLQNEKENLKKLKPKAIQVRMSQIIKQNAVVGTRDNQAHEYNVDNEARRLGFSTEIYALNFPKILKDLLPSSWR